MSQRAPGETVAIRAWGYNGGVHYFPQAPYTYAVAGLMNEKQVSIVETTWGGRKELRNPEGWQGYFDLMNLALQRAASAREAIAVMHKLVQEYVPKQGRNLRRESAFYVALVAQVSALKWNLHHRDASGHFRDRSLRDVSKGNAG